ncbi:hypothetical protein HYALB_00004480 [Hymenoscyphus albidus]|uniref:Extracellular mutant protein 11 C-terminal domain-containing protein n=1 Tax=Hymenoscyphus albidus TaxID=595503 RepID=A0A9N9QCD1_9HELO|nr:hypothetical protein HYALB_00004480 [Hymenoscyphus albidus]
MSNVTSFLARRTGTPTPDPTTATMTTKQERADRAKGSKVGVRNTRARTQPSARGDTITTDFRSPTPTRQQAYNPTRQNGNPPNRPFNSRRAAMTEDQGDGAGFDTTVSTNFDQTMSELPAHVHSELSMRGEMFDGGSDGAPGYFPENVRFEQEEGSDEYEDTQHADIHVAMARNPAEATSQPLHRKNGEDSLPRVDYGETQEMEFQARQNDIAGRFAASNNQARAESPTKSGRGASQKRAHSQHMNETNNFPIRSSFEKRQTGRFENDTLDVQTRNDIFHDASGFTSPAPVDDTNHHDFNGHASSNAADGDDDDSFDDAVEVDYTDAELAGMDFATLKREEWGFNYNERTIDLKGLPREATLAQQLDVVKTLDWEDQMQFFLHMPENEWEEAGQLIMAKIADIMKSVREIRTRKREVAAKYEQLYEKREQLVRRKDDRLTAKLGRMENTGRAVLNN